MNQGVSKPTASSISLVLTAIGDDRPGLVEQLATAISEHRGNWLESSMSHLAGQFAGIVCVAIAPADAEALTSALDRLPGLRVTCASSTVSASSQTDSPAPNSGGPLRAAASANRRLKLALVGHDRIGIVREVSQVLVRHSINVETLATHTGSAPMSAEILFYANAELTASAALDARALTSDLERLSNELMVDITLDETIRS